MTRLIFLTFYGNARYERLPVISGGSARTSRADATVATVATDADADDDSDPSPTVSYGDAGRAAPSEHPPHESPPIMVLPVMVLAVLAAIGGIINLPFTSMELLNEWLEPSFRGVPEVHPDSFIEGLALEVLSVALALVGILHRATALPQGLAAGRGAARREARRDRTRARERLLLRRRHRQARRRPRPRRSRTWLDRVVDTKIIDGAVNGIGGLVSAARPRLAARCRTASSGATRSAIAFGAVACPALRRHPGRLTVGDFPILTAIIVVPVRRRADHAAHAPRAARRSPRRSATPPRRSPSGFAACLLWNFRRGLGDFQFVENRPLDPARSASATSSASTASASS